jgi:hypothetical protein
MKKTRNLYLLFVFVCFLAVVISGCKSSDTVSEQEVVSSDNSETVVDTQEPSETDDTSEKAPETSENVSSDETSSDAQDVTVENSSQDADDNTDTAVADTSSDDVSDDIQEKLDRIDELLSEVESLRGTFSSQLESLESQATGEYLKLDSSERTDDKKSEIALKYYNLASGLESQCDAKIDSICAELQLLLIKTGGDQSKVSEIRSEYNSEKSALKEEYMSIYGGYLG